MRDYGYSLVAMWAVTGYHEGIPGYQCDSIQHWGCTPEHALEALINCLHHDEHLSVARLKSKHEEAKALNQKRVEDKYLERYQQKGEDFHIIEPGEDISWLLQ